MTGLLEPGGALPEVCRRVAQAGVSILIQSTLLLVLGLLVGAVLRRRGPDVVSLVYRATLAGVALGAVLSVLVAGRLHPVWTVSLPPVEASAERSSARGAAAAEFSALPPRVPVAAAADTAREAPRRWTIEGLPPLCYVAPVALWVAGTALLAAWLLLSHLHIARLRKRGVPVSERDAAALLQSLHTSGPGPVPLLLLSRDVRSPFLTGLRRPAILLPASYATEYQGNALRAVLAHEITHLLRRDCGWYLLARWACALCWTQPLLWVLCRRLEQVSEEVCDRAALEQDCSPGAYADCLLTLAERARAPRLERFAGVGAIAFRSSLGRRIQQILQGPRHPLPRPSSPLRVVVASGTVSAVFGVVLSVSVTERAQNAHSGASTSRRAAAAAVTAPSARVPVRVADATGGKRPAAAPETRRSRHPRRAAGARVRSSADSPRSRRPRHVAFRSGDKQKRIARPKDMSGRSSSYPRLVQAATKAQRNAETRIAFLSERAEGRSHALLADEDAGRQESSLSAAAVMTDAQSPVPYPQDPAPSAAFAFADSQAQAEATDLDSASLSPHLPSRTAERQARQPRRAKPPCRPHSEGGAEPVRHEHSNTPRFATQDPPLPSEAQAGGGSGETVEVGIDGPIVTVRVTKRLTRDQEDITLVWYRDFYILY